MDWTRGLLIKQPWVDLIVDGHKGWELRSRRTKIRGPIAIIQSKSGLIVGGAELMACIPLTEAKIRNNIHQHHVDPSKAKEYGDPLFAWVLMNAYRLPEPIPYKHPRGAVIWVNLHN